MISTGARMYYLHLARQSSVSELSVLTVKGLLIGTPSSTSCEKDPTKAGGENPGEWAAVGYRDGTLYLDFPGLLQKGTRASKWFTVMQEHGKHIYDGEPFVRVCALVKHLEMFALLGVFLLTRVAQQPAESTAGASASTGLQDWAKYMGAKAEPEAWEYTGAFGELYVLSRLIDTRGHQAVAWWLGPDRAAQDFKVPVDRHNEAGIEVKTAGEGAGVARISGLHQLCSPGILLTVELGALTTGINTHSVLSLVQHIEKSLAHAQEPLALFKAQLKKIGLDTQSPEYVSQRCISRVVYWDMADLPSLSSRGPGKDFITSVNWVVSLPQGSIVNQNADLIDIVTTAVAGSETAS